jgi:hypothetical protein
MTAASHRFTFVPIAAIAAIAAIGAFLLLRDAETSELARGADVAVSCGAAQRAVVRQTVTDGLPHVDIQCVDGVVEGQAASYVVDQSGRVTRIFDEEPTERIAAYTRVARAELEPALTPAIYQPAQAAAPRVAAAPVRARAPVVKKGPSWQKRALVIGGTAGAGAGIGALVGGKKGALIGAAVGGGGAALVDALKRD